MTTGRESGYIISYNAFMSSSINFDSIVFRRAVKYVTIHLTKEEQAISTLARVHHGLNSLCILSSFEIKKVHRDTT